MKHHHKHPHGHKKKMGRTPHRRNLLQCIGCDTIIKDGATKDRQLGRCATCLKEIGLDTIARGLA